MERFSVSRVSDKSSSKNKVASGVRNEIALNVGDLNNGQGKTQAVSDPDLDRRRFSLQQLTR